VIILSVDNHSPVTLKISC